MAIARRVSPPPPAQGGSVSFGEDSFYTGGLGLPEGNYAVTFAFQMFQPTKADGKPSSVPPFLAVMGTFYPIDPKTGALTGEPQEHPMGMGSNAHESFVPSADGKGLDAVPNGKGSGVWKLSNWGIFFESLKQVGLPPGLVTNDISPLDGIWVHTQNIPEPEEKKAAGKKARAKTGAAGMMGGPAAAEQERDRTCVVVTEILENGQPWAGGGGIPDAEQAAPVKAAPKTTARPAAPARAAAPVARGPRPVAAPAPAAESGITDEDIQTAVADTLSQVLQKNPAGMKTVALKTQAFQAIKTTYGEEAAQLAGDYINQNEMLNAALSELGFGISGFDVKPL